MSLHPSNLEDHLGYWLRCLSNFVSHSFASKLEVQGVSVAQWVVLRTLYDKKALSLNEAAEAVGVDKSSLSRMIDRLVQKELVMRQDGINRRTLKLMLTPTGRKLVPQLAKLADANDKAFFQSLPVKKRQQFLDTIQALLVANGWDIATHGKNRME